HSKSVKEFIASDDALLDQIPENADPVDITDNIRLIGRSEHDEWHLRRIVYGDRPSPDAIVIGSYLGDTVHVGGGRLRGTKVAAQLEFSVLVHTLAVAARFASQPHFMQNAGVSG